MDTLFCILSWTLVVLINLFTLILAIRTNLLRDEIDDPVAFLAAAARTAKFKNKSIDEIPRPYSLARVQLSAWTVIVSSAYLTHVLCMKCNIKLADSTTTLSLLGISAATAGLANVIDKGNAADKLQAGAGAIPRHQNKPSEGFWFDILSDESGVSIHRFQNVVFTVIAMAIYLSKLANCPLPELDGTLLTLAGVSNMAYLGIKANENR
jgi:hypothetical protein